MLDWVRHVFSCCAYGESIALARKRRSGSSPLRCEHFQELI